MDRLPDVFGLYILPPIMDVHRTITRRIPLGRFMGRVFALIHRRRTFRTLFAKRVTPVSDKTRTWCA